MVAAPAEGLAARRSSGERWELYRLLGEPVRLRLLALAAQEELAVGELAELLGEGQPNVSRHAAPLRQAGLLVVRKEGTRALIRLAEGAGNDAVVADALVAGRALCVEDGSLRRIHEVVRARDAASRAFFARDGKDDRDSDLSPFPVELGAYLSALAPLIPHRRLAVDAGTGDGGLLEVIARVFDRVVAFDREDAQLARCAARIAQRGFDNVELARGEVGSDDVVSLVRARGLADVVFATRLLHHAPKPAAAVAALSQLARPGGAIVIVDYASHDDESMRDQADLWLGFEETELFRFARDAGLVDPVVRGLAPLSSTSTKNGRGHRSPDAHLPWQVMVARRPAAEPSLTNEATRRPQRRRT
jgi:DNA-binding transcriptional ArsR family regulator/protein-L-isoaspartate O-methyltransferase